jgi:C4-dicarboxylate-specific signal transduction histidine kinase
MIFLGMDTVDFMPHGHCVLWQEKILYPMVASDVTIFLSYSAIPFGLFYFYRNRTDLSPKVKALLILFVLFIQFCGFSHLITAYNYWNADYHWELIIKVLTAFVSLATAIVVVKNIKALLELPSPQQYSLVNRKLKELNEKLEEQVKARTEELRLKTSLLESIITSIDDGIVEYTPIKDDKNNIVDFSAKVLNDKIEYQTGMPKDNMETDSMNRDFPYYVEDKSLDDFIDFYNNGGRKVYDPSSIKLNHRTYRAIYTKNIKNNSILLFLTNITEQENLRMQSITNSRLSAIGGVAHEINTPLQIISGAARQAERQIPDVTEDQRKSFELIRTTIKRISKIVKNLKRLTHQSSDEIVTLKISNFLDEVKGFVSTKINNASVTLLSTYKDQEDFSIEANEVALSQILINLINNSIDELTEIEENGKEKVIEIQIFQNEHSKSIVISDNGNGIPEEHISKIFTPLFTTKEVDKGTGLGLSLSSRLAHNMGANIQVIQDGRTHFHIVFNNKNES